MRIVHDARAISHGTTRAKVPEGVASKRIPPLNPPVRAMGARNRARRRWPTNSGREPQIEPTLLNTSATVLDTLALSGGSPTASKAG